MPLSEGSLYNFNLQAYMKLADFEQMSKDCLARADVNHAEAPVQTEHLGNRLNRRHRNLLQNYEPAEI